MEMFIGTSSRTVLGGGVKPSLSLELAGSQTLDPRITFTRASGGTYFDSTGVLQTAGNNGPRFDYNPTTLAARGLLIEEQRTNSIRNNTMQGAVAGTPGTLPTNWQGVTTTNGLNREIVGSGVSNGINYIDVRYSGTTTGSAFVNIVLPEANNFIAAANGQSWASSAWVAVVGGSTANLTGLFLRVRFSDAAAVELTSANVSLLTATSQMQRFSVALTAANASTAFVSQNFSMQFNTGVAIDITLRIGLPQLEQGAFATSVIPTTGSQATRAADSAVMTGSNFSPWYNQSEGTFFGEVAFGFVPSASQFPSLLAASDGTSAESHQIYWTATNAAVYEIRDGGVQQAAMTRTDASPLKWAGAYKLNDCALVVDGGAPGTDSAATMPTPDRLYIGANAVGAQFVNGHIRRITYYPTRLPNATLQALTT